MYTYIHIIYHVSSITYKMTAKYRIYTHVHLCGDAHVANFTEIARTMRGQIYEGELQTPPKHLGEDLAGDCKQPPHGSPQILFSNLCVCQPRTEYHGNMHSRTGGRASGPANSASVFHLTSLLRPKLHIGLGGIPNYHYQHKNRTE